MNESEKKMGGTEEIVIGESFFVKEPIQDSSESNIQSGPRLTEGDIIAMLRERYSDDGYAVFTQVRSETGYSGRERYADVIVMCLWPSRGFEIMGFEIKVHRSDWLKELHAPEKAEAICQYCDRWTIVAPRGIVKQEELPQTWGLMTASEKGLRFTKTSPALSPVPLNRGFVASILRQAARSQDAVVEAIIEKRVQQKLQQISTTVEYWKERVERAEREASELRQRERDFTDQFGMRYFRITVPEIAESLQILRDPLVLTRRITDLTDYLDSLKEVVHQIDTVISTVQNADAVFKKSIQELPKTKQSTHHEQHRSSGMEW